MLDGLAGEVGEDDDVAEVGVDGVVGGAAGDEADFGAVEVAVIDNLGSPGCCLLPLAPWGSACLAALEG